MDALDASCTASPDTVNVNDTVAFSANATGGNGVYRYQWSGSDGISGTSQVLTKRFTTAGTKVASLTVTSGTQTVTRACTAVVTTVVIPPPGALVATCTANPSSVNINDTIAFSGSASGGTGSYVYHWSGTDGISGTSQVVTGRFTTAGTKTAILTVTSGGNVVTTSCSATVNPVTPPQVDALDASCTASPDTVNVNDTVAFSANATGGNGVYRYQWSGSDGISGTSQVLTKRFTTAGTKTASLTVTSGTQTVTRTCAVAVNQNNITNNLDAVCTINPNPVNVGDTVTLSANASGGSGVYHYQWSGSDGISGTSQVLNKTFPTSGTKTASLTVTSGTQTVTRSCSVVVNQNNITNDLDGSCTINPNPVNVNDSVTLSANATGGSGNYRYQWSGSDGISGTSQVINKTFTTVGTKVASLTITSGTQTVTRTCSVAVNQNNITNNLDAVCTINPNPVNVGDTATLSANASGGNGHYSYQWSGSDGITGSSQVITRSFSTSGTKNVSLTVTSAGQTVTRTCSVSVNPYNNYNYNYNYGYNYNYNSGYNYNYNTNMTATCSASPMNANVGDNVIWTVYPVGGTGVYTYSWTGTDGLSYGNAYQIQQRYTTPGVKNATVTVYTTNGQSVVATCSTNIMGSISNGTPISGIYLNEVPATGISFNVKVSLYTLGLIIWSAFMGLMIVERRKTKLALANRAKIEAFKSENLKRKGMN